MDLRGSDRNCLLIRKAFPFTSWTACIFLTLSSYSQNSGSRIHVKLHDVPEAKSPAQTVSKPDPPSCPPGDPVGTDASFTQPGGHKVTLSWNASTSASGPSANEIFYCLYRTKGGPVRTNTAGTVSPCVNCQRVTKASIAETKQVDIQIENGAHYCYVAVAIDSRNGKLSVLSNQADAIIPPNKEQPFCNPGNGNPKQADSRKHSGRH